MAKGEDSFGSCDGEGPPSTSSEDVLLRVDSVGIVMWLKPVGESGPTRFGRSFPFLPMSRSCLGPRVVVCMDKDRGKMNFIY